MTRPMAEAAWVETNQRYLVARLAQVRAWLEAFVGEPPAEPRPADPEFDPATPPALELLCSKFGLTGFERAILLLCAGVELEAQFAPLCAKAQRDPSRTWPTFSLALAALPGAHWSALTPEAPLRRWRLVEATGMSGALTTSPLRINERVLHYLAGIQYIDTRLTGLIEPIPQSVQLVPSHHEVAAQIAALWRAESPAPLVQLCGADEYTRRAVAAAACASLQIGIHALVAESIPTPPAEMEELLRLWEREAALIQSALYVEAGPASTPETPAGAAASRLLERIGAACIFSSRDRWRPVRRGMATLELHKPTTREQQAVWQSALGNQAAQLNGAVSELVAQFSMNESSIRASARSALASASPQALRRELWDASRAQSRPALDDLAQRIEPVARWDDLVLPPNEKRQLREIVAQVAGRALVYDDWGFASMGSRGLGISALFAGPSGTGKTMAAEVLSNQLRLDLYRIDLSCVVSKYIGETEKNLRRVFDAAEQGGVILFFDEADALFGKRSEVKDSHDRYANIEINYLLQRMEAYRGLAVLATNMKGALDPAFMRRLRFVVNFPFPDASMRLEIWRRAFPPNAPIESLDLAKLARLDLPGGSIRNVALGAAFLAAGEGAPVGMAHLIQAARTEFAKLEKPWSEGQSWGLV